ncbi:phenylalanine--tRNA ligase subunit alpha [Helicobacter burdigaliensis]|uniref:phenylalanine--tRNA ligase subunit alpha n=1 Tax=Helicobacter burdigaliensis TaxID=2315334 RepID=UPI000EF666C6|nr:phenylalanine--tRNA ligase subunit alpha [Helicobacter burdigaliensis]
MKEIFTQIKEASTLAKLEEIRISLLGKKGSLTASFSALRDLGEEERKQKAKELNLLKLEVEKALSDKKEALSFLELQAKLEQEKIDVSLFTPSSLRGSIHPVMLMMDRIVEYFTSMNFSLEMGPLVEDDFHNFEALNLPKYHPARDMQDTFYFKDGKLLRTHTSPVQIRTMESQKPPIRMICPGSVFRCDYDLTHTPMFHQVEGLVVEEGSDSVSFANLKFILEDFLKYIFGEVKVRFRSSFFPFTEPSAEVDMSCIFCGGSGCRVCSHTGWLEVLGCGCVDNNVFRAVGYENVSGYAFGMGVERFAMLAYSVPDLRAFFESDLRILEQFK